MNDLRSYYNSDVKAVVENYKFLNCCGRINSKDIYIGWDVLILPVDYHKSGVNEKSHSGANEKSQSGTTERDESKVECFASGPKVDCYSVYYKVSRSKYISMEKFIKQCGTMPTPSTFSKFYNITYRQFGLSSIVTNGKRSWYKIIN